MISLFVTWCIFALCTYCNGIEQTHSNCGVLNHTSVNHYDFVVNVASNGHILCSGVVISPLIILVPAHCIANHHRNKLYVLVGDKNETINLENLIVHPKYDVSSPTGLHDLAILKLDRSLKTNKNSVCLPDIGDDPVDGCLIKHASKNYYVEINFKPSMSCIETPFLRGYIQSQEDIICTKQDCHNELKGPVFCQVGSRYQITGLSTDKDNWCHVGAFTRIARYEGWIRYTAEYLQGELLSRDRYAALEQEDEMEEEKQIALLEKSNPCLSSPCGIHGICWKSGNNFMCTCDPQYPYGNPYSKCEKCLSDHHCSGDKSKCINHTCQNQTDQLNEFKEKIPTEYVQIGNSWYFISKNRLSWLQAQDQCIQKHGHLAVISEMTSELADLLASKSRQQIGVENKYWVGANDLKVEGKFEWLKTGKTLDKNSWSYYGQTPVGIEHDRHCIKISSNLTLWAHACESLSQYVCQYELPSVDTNDVSSSRRKRQRSFDSLNPRANYKDICGRRFIRQGRIVGGGISNYGEWPWQVSLRQYKDGDYRHKCGAALLTERWIITAAHCVKNISPSNLLVRIGEYNVLDRSEPHEHIQRRIMRIVTHKNFEKISYENDIALLKLSTRVDFQPNIIPICLPRTNDHLVGRIGTVTGWGRKSEYGRISSILREVSIPIISNEQCMKMYRDSGQSEWIPRIFVCAGTTNGGKDSCEGDSGGPMVVKNSQGRYELAGIISWGIGCGSQNRPGVYTRITAFRSWIKRNTNY